MSDLNETAWGLIANAWNGDWSKAPQEWVDTAIDWRDAYYVSISPQAVLTKTLMQEYNMPLSEAESFANFILNSNEIAELILGRADERAEHTTAANNPVTALWAG